MEMSLQYSKSNITMQIKVISMFLWFSWRGKRRRAELDLIRWFEYCLQVLLNNKQYFALSSMTSQNIRDEDRI